MTEWFCFTMPDGMRRCINLAAVESVKFTENLAVIELAGDAGHYWDVTDPDDIYRLKQLLGDTKS